MLQLVLLVSAANSAALALSLISDCASDVGTEKTALFRPVRYFTSVSPFRAFSAATKRATSSGAPVTATVCEDWEEHPTRANAANATLSAFIAINPREQGCEHSRWVRVRNGWKLTLMPCGKPAFASGAVVFIKCSHRPHVSRRQRDDAPRPDWVRSNPNDRHER